MEKLNQNAFRLSVEWARIEPKEGEFDKKETEHYKKVLESLKDKNIKTFVTLHHFTNPIWFAEKGGWENFNSSKYFSRYAKYCAENFGDLVDFWITINEPLVYITFSYLMGKWPPGKINPFKAFLVFINLITSHHHSFSTIKKVLSDSCKVGFAKNNIYFGKFNLLKVLWNHLFITLCAKKYDFIGLNYYMDKRMIKLGVKRSDTGLVISPVGIFQVLKELEIYNKPIYITENGVADAKDTLRENFIKDHLLYVNKAVQEGVDIRGYLYWSLIDNYEWHWGFAPRFGLIEIDRRHGLKRIIRNSALYYAKVCKENSVIIN